MNPTLTPTPRRRFSLTLEDAEPDHPAPPHRRLARVLKGLLRAHGFRCTSAVEVTQPPEEPHAESENPGAGQ